jgi:ATP-dependent Clp protease ATP-binding subunit ClpC
VFERYTERARRAIFFARYEASNLNSGYIETEHLLLGLLREYKLLGKLSHGVDEAIRKEIENWTPKVTSQTSTSVDLPLSGESRLALLYASQESQTLKQDLIDAGHLVLGLLRG